MNSKIKADLKSAILSITKGDTEKASELFRRVMASKVASVMGITEADEDELEPLDNQDEEPSVEPIEEPSEDEEDEDKEIFTFTIKHKENASKIKRELKARAVKFEFDDKTDDFFYFKFTNESEFEKGKLIAERFIDKSLEQ
jgi:hypothetical protein